MELHYWEKQLILYTKARYGEINYERDLDIFASKLYGIGRKHIDQYNINSMVCDLYNKLYDNGHIKFKLEGFLVNIFKRASLKRGSNSVIWDDVIRQMLSEIQGIRVLDRIDLGSIDYGLYEELNPMPSRDWFAINNFD